MTAPVAQKASPAATPVAPVAAPVAQKAAPVASTVVTPEAAQSAENMTIKAVADPVADEMAAEDKSGTVAGFVDKVDKK